MHAFESNSYYCIISCPQLEFNYYGLQYRYCYIECAIMAQIISKENNLLNDIIQPLHPVLSFDLSMFMNIFMTFVPGRIRMIEIDQVDLGLSRENLINGLENGVVQAYLKYFFVKGLKDLKVERIWLYWD